MVRGRATSSRSRLRRHRPSASVPVVAHALRVRLGLLSDGTRAGDGVGGFGFGYFDVFAVAEAGHEGWFAGSRGCCGGCCVASACHCAGLCVILLALCVRDSRVVAVLFLRGLRVGKLVFDGETEGRESFLYLSILAMWCQTQGVKRYDCTTYSRDT